MSGCPFKHPAVSKLLISAAAALLGGVFTALLSGHHPVPLVLEIDPPAHALADHTDGVKQCGCH